MKDSKTAVWELCVLLHQGSTQTKGTRTLRQSLSSLVLHSSVRPVRPTPSQDCEAPSNILLQTAHQSRRDGEMMYHWPNGRFSVKEEQGLNEQPGLRWGRADGGRIRCRFRCTDADALAHQRLPCKKRTTQPPSDTMALPGWYCLIFQKQSKRSWPFMACFLGWKLLTTTGIIFTKRAGAEISGLRWFKIL